MLYFAKLDENNVVTEVHLVHEDEVNNLTFPASEPIGIELLKQKTKHSKWLQTCESANYRLRFARVGYTYNPQYNVFVPPKTFESWVFDNITFKWVPPKEYPNDNKPYIWDESIQDWKEYTI